MRLPVYMDYAATTPVDPQVARVMADCLTMDGTFGNPASRTHSYGWMAAETVDIARAQVARLVGADHREIIFTSGATESDNAAIIGTALSLESRGRHIVTSAIEHKAVLDTCAFLEKRGFEVTYLVPDSRGVVTPEQVEAALRPNTILVSIMHVNNELGTVYDIGAIGEICRGRGVLFHSDAAQSLGKEKIDVSSMKVDLMSLSAHKIYGPKGIGALYIRRAPEVRPAALIHGGGHERGFRSGTLATHQIAGFGKACQLAEERFDEDTARIRALRDDLEQKLSRLPGVFVNGRAPARVCGILNAGFRGADSEILISSLKDVAVSSGSACSSNRKTVSESLKAIGAPDWAHESTVRFSFSCERPVLMMILPFSRVPLST